MCLGETQANRVMERLGESLTVIMHTTAEKTSVRLVASVGAKCYRACNEPARQSL
jgi:hypothetical protein